MNDDSPQSDDRIPILLDLGLSERELYFIGRIVAAWGALESEIFKQTIVALTRGSTDKLPSAMNNMQASKVRELWKTHVVDKADGERRRSLLDQHAKIERYSEQRNAIIHGMWNWSTSEPEKITVWRVRNEKLDSTVFTADDLMNISLEVDEINFRLRFPVDDDLNEAVPFMSRRMIATLGGHPIAKDLWQGLNPEKEDPSK